MFKSKAGLSDADMAGGMAMPAGMMMGAGPAAGPAAAEEEAAPAAPVKEYFDIKLVSFNPANKIKVIKEIRALTGLGLKEAKDVVEGAPAIVKKDVKKDEGEEIIAKLKEIEAVAELD
ncbi:ribosomal protein L7/L12 C-terminal domain-containing protein [Pelagophyceae sp. CCMP2097]|nr:ribosomal protein L7/L12 C-terminal domain-containing protein [Pelagophyceae sp. CCMP2097]